MAGMYVILLDNIKITNGGAVSRVIYENGFAPVSIQAEGPTADIVYQTMIRSTSYYLLGGQRVAMRRMGYVGGNGLTFLMGDHLGSTSVAVNEQGSLVGGPQLYKAWGETRAGSLPTKYQYTGQYNDSDIKLLWYGSRWYDSYLSRFTSPDTIIPLASQGVQAWDRYAYTNNNPLRYTDPTGHDVASLPWPQIFETAAAAETASSAGGPPTMLIVGVVIVVAVAVIVIIEVSSENNDEQQGNSNDGNGGETSETENLENSGKINSLDELFDPSVAYEKLNGKTPEDVDELLDLAEKKWLECRRDGQGSTQRRGVNGKRSKKWKYY